uniref:Uncharacterized protein n=1 Tax=Chenopodium quinoa TaxID=63459 RepID=A0A803MSF4_CHEQI
MMRLLLQWTLKLKGLVPPRILPDDQTRGSRDHLADAVSCFAESFKEYVSRAQGPPKPSSQEIYKVVSSVLGISRHQVLKVLKRFMNGTVDEFEILKNLPEGEKLDWVLLCIND